jgi:hypothetical protein
VTTVALTAAMAVDGVVGDSAAAVAASTVQISL